MFRVLALAFVAACGSSAGVDMPASPGTDAAMNAAADAAVAGDGSAPDTRLYPAEVGRSWTTQSIINNPTSGTETCNYTGTITGTSMLDGRPVFDVETDTSCTSGSTSTTSQISVVGDVVESWAAASNPPMWYRSVDEPVQIGHSWDSYAQPPAGAAITRTWVSTGSVTVAAGTFTDCWTQSWGSETVTIIGYDTYCRGVGYVQASANYGCDTCETSTTQLISKNF